MSTPPFSCWCPEPANQGILATKYRLLISVCCAICSAWGSSTACLGWVRMKSWQVLVILQAFGLLVVWPALVVFTGGSIYLTVQNLDSLNAKFGSYASTLLLSAISIISQWLVHITIPLERWSPRIQSNVSLAFRSHQHLLYISAKRSPFTCFWHSPFPLWPFLVKNSWAHCMRYFEIVKPGGLVPFCVSVFVCFLDLR